MDTELSQDPTIRQLKVFDTVSGACLLTLTGHGACVMAVAVTPDGMKIVTGSEDMSTKVYDISSGACLMTLTHQTHVLSIAITPCGNKLVTGFYGGAVKLFDISFHWTISTHPLSLPVVRAAVRAFHYVCIVLPVCDDLTRAALAFRGRML